MISSWRCDCVCPVFVLYAGPRFIMSLSAANLKSNPYNFPSGADRDREPASVLLTRQRSELRWSAQTLTLYLNVIIVNYGSILQLTEPSLVRADQVGLLLASTAISLLMSIVSEIATNQATERL